MGDERAVVSYYNPRNSPFSGDIILDDMDPSPPDLDAPSSSNPRLDPLTPLNAAAISDPTDPFCDHLIWNLCEDGNPHECNSLDFHENSVLNISELLGEMHEEENVQCDQDSYTFQDTMPLSVWPPPPSPYTCSYCHVLREIIHFNERTNDSSKLEIHGRVGFICHAILDETVNSTSSNNQHKMFDFCKKSYEDVKRFLMEYCMSRKQAGYVMITDPLFPFYEALCIGLNLNETVNDAEEVCLQPSSFHSTDVGHVNQMESEFQNADRIPRISLAAQRERSGKLTIADLKNYFDMPIEEAGRQLNLCPTVLKKICRKHNLQRWPFRKVKSLKKSLSKWTRSLNSEDHGERALAQAEIEKIQRSLSSIYGESQ